MKLMFTVFMIVILNLFKIFAQDIISEKNYYISFEQNDAISKNTIFSSSSYYQSIKTDDNGLLFLFSNLYAYTDTLLNIASELTFPSIAKIDKDLNFQWLTELRGSNNIINYSLNSMGENISLNGNLCTNGDAQNGWGGCYPVVFELDKLGNKKSEKFNLSGYSLSNADNKFWSSGEFLNIIYSDGERLIYDMISKDTYELTKRDTILNFPKNSENQIETYYEVSEWQYIDDENIIIHGYSMQGMTIKNFAMIYNKIEKSYNLIENELFESNQSPEFVFMNETKIILYNQFYIILLDRATLSEISSIATVELGIPNSVYSYLNSVDITAGNELILSITNYKDNKIYYSVIKTDINFNVVWQTDFEKDCNLNSLTKVRTLQNGLIAFATVCNDSLKLKIIKDNTVGVSEDISLNAESMISPNPAADFIEINIGSKRFKPFVESEDVQIYNILGVEVGQSSLIDGNNRINISQLPAGVYYIKIGSRVEKFVKM
jgi:hypothetical protein